MSSHCKARNITEKDIEFTRNWIRQNLETVPGSEIIFSETYDNYCSSCLLKNVSSVAKNSFGPLIIKEFPNRFVSTKSRNKKSFQLYHNIAQRYQSLVPSDNNSNRNDTIFSFPHNDNELSSLSRNNKDDTSIQEKCIASGDGNNEKNHINRSVLSFVSSSSLSTTIRSSSSSENTSDKDMSVASVVNNNVSPTTLCIRNQFPDETVQVQSTASLISSTCGFHRADTRSPIIQRSNDMMVDFFRLYERHCDDILYLILMEQFDMIEECMVCFHQKILSKNFRQFIINDQLEDISNLICQLDTSFYNTLKTSIFAVMSHLPTLNHELDASLEKYTKQLKAYITKALEGYPSSLRVRKIQIARDFSSKIFRHIKLTRLAEQVAVSFSQDQEFSTYTKQFWKNIDISFIVDNGPCCFVTQESDTDKIKDILINDVGDLLFHYDDKKATFQQWIRHMEDNIEHFISTQLPTGPGSEFYRSCEEKFVLKWTFYTSRILEEAIVMPQAKHFGQFSEFIFFLNELIQFLVNASVTNLIRDIL